MGVWWEEREREGRRRVLTFVLSNATNHSLCWIRCCRRRSSRRMQRHTRWILSHASHADGSGEGEGRGRARGSFHRLVSVDFSSFSHSLSPPIPPSFHLTLFTLLLVVLSIQGGYNVDAISNAALACTRVLLGETPDMLGPMTASDSATQTVSDVSKVQSRHWKSIDPRACQPRDCESTWIPFFLPPPLSNADCFKCSSLVEQLSERNRILLPMSLVSLEVLIGPDECCSLIPVPSTLSELLLAYRNQHLYSRYRLCSFPLVTPELERAFPEHVLCS